MPQKIKIVSNDIGIFFNMKTENAKYEKKGTHFPSIGSDDLGVKNVKIQENSEKIRGPPGDPLQPFLGPYIFLSPPEAKKVKILTFFVPGGPKKIFMGLKRGVEGP